VPMFDAVTMCFRLGDFDAQKLGDGFSFFTAADLQNLGTGEAICRIERADYDFNLKTLPLPEILATASEIREKCIASSRMKYAQKREEIEGEAVARAASVEPPSVSDEKHVAPPIQTDVTKKARTSKSQPTEKAISAHTPGRGGAQHKYLQQLVKKMAEGHGYRATIEKEVLGGLGKVDVLIERDDEKIACEISVTSTEEHELANVQKCIAAGYRSVVVISPDRKTSNRFAAYMSECLEPKALESIFFLLPDEFPQFLDKQTLTAPPASHTLVRGYRVKVSYQPAGAKENLAKQQSVSNVIVQAMRRLKSQELPGGL
jgi:hypothetical protein